MIYRIIRQKTRQTFERVNAHDYEAIAKDLRPDIHHRFAGDHAPGGERHDEKHVLLWFERLGRVMPSLYLTPTDIWIQGGATQGRRYRPLDRSGNIRRWNDLPESRRSYHPP